MYIEKKADSAVRAPRSELLQEPGKKAKLPRDSCKYIFYLMV